MFAVRFELAFVVVSGLLASAFLFVLAHEAFHLAFADEAHGVCFGRCDICRGMVSLGQAEGAAYGAHNDLSRNEFLANAVGLSAVFAFVFFGFCSWYFNREVAVG